MCMDGYIMLEEWGGGEGTKWVTEKVTASTRLKTIKINHGKSINSIEYTYQVDRDEHRSGLLGSTKGEKEHQIILEEGEEVTAIYGRYGQLVKGGPTVIRWLKLMTSKPRPFVCGDKEAMGKDFSVVLREGKIVGFHGRATKDNIDAIGIYMAPK